MPEKEQVYYYNGTENVPTVIWARILAPGRCKWRGDRNGHILDDQGKVIGSYYPYPTGQPGWSVWTTEYAGYAYPDELEIVDETEKSGRKRR